MKPYNDITAAVPFDIGMGTMMPDAQIMKTGKVRSDVYFSPERFEIEREIFRTSWLWAGRVEQIQNPGDWFVKELEICKTSVIVTRDRDQSIRAFHNVCTHRGMRLKWDKCGHNNLITCPYHAWSFGTDGKCKVITDEDAFVGVRKEDMGLKTVNVAAWAGFIFINLDAHPRQTLLEFLGPVADRISDAPFEDFTCAAQITDMLDANWKLGFDAVAEAYHVPALHSKSASEWAVPTTNPFMHCIGWEGVGPHRVTSISGNKEFRTGPARPVQDFAWTKCGRQNHVVSNPDEKATNVRHFRDHPKINVLDSPDWVNDAYYLFPTTVIFAATNGWFMQEYLPLTVDKTRFTAIFYFQKPQSCREQFSLNYSVVSSRDVTTEDTFSVRGQHAGLVSGVLDHVHFGFAEIIPRHIAAVMQSVVEGYQKAKGQSR